MPLSRIEVLPRSQTCRLIDYDSAEVVRGPDDSAWFLHVSGATPCINMTVQLVPRFYRQHPDFWEIEVVAFIPSGVYIGSIGGFSVTIPISLIAGTAGVQGVEVVGASMRERYEVPGVPVG